MKNGDSPPGDTTEGTVPIFHKPPITHPLHKNAFCLTVICICAFSFGGIQAQDNYAGILPGYEIDYKHEWLLDKNKLGELSRAIVKKEVFCIVDDLKAVARKSKLLGTFGRNTMRQASDVLGIGNQSVEFLSQSLQDMNLDWKIKFWIVDILGYLKCDDSLRVLKRIMFDKSEKPDIRKRAIQSFERISDKIS